MSPAAVQSDFSEDELVHAAQLFHRDLEGVFIGVVFDDVVIHVDQNPVISYMAALGFLTLIAKTREQNLYSFGN